MRGNRSLDEFGAPDDAEESEPASAEPAATDASDTTASAEDMDPSEPDTTAAADDEPRDPPASTYVWRPDGGPCAACGERVEERWRDGDGLVCSACKEW